MLTAGAPGKPPALGSVSFDERQGLRRREVSKHSLTGSSLSLGRIVDRRCLGDQSDTDRPTVAGAARVFEKALPTLSGPFVLPIVTRIGLSIRIELQPSQPRLG